MRAILSIAIALLFLSTIFAVVPGCDDSLEFANTPPGGLSISRNKCYLGQNDQVVLTGDATDADGDSISYSWTAESGTLSPADGKGRIVTWTAPASHGTYRVTLRVTDGLDASSKGLDIDVGRKLGLIHNDLTLDQTDYPYIFDSISPIYIPDLFIVTIEAGVTIIFNEGGGGFRVGGSLVVNGTLQDRVLFMPNVCPGEERVWKGLEFTGSSAVGTLSYVTLNSSADGLTVEDEATVTADNLIIDQTTADGLSVITGASAVITDSRIWDNGGGVYVAYGELQISNSSIRYNNNYGFSLMAGATNAIGVTSCEIANNGRVGFSLAGDASPVVHGCSMFFNGPFDETVTVKFINTYSNTSPVDMTGNYWGTDDALNIPPQIKRDGANGIVDYSGWLSEDPL